MGIVGNDYWYGKAVGSNNEGVHGLDGGNIGFTVYWDNGPVGNYVGHVEDSGFAVGTTYDTQGGRGSDVGWKSHNQLKCINFPPPPPKDDVLKPDRVIEPTDPDSPWYKPPSQPMQGGPAPLNPPPGSKLATVQADVDVYNAKNEPPASVGQVVGILRAEPRPRQVELVGDCAPQSWCQVKGPDVPGGQGWVWGHLDLP
jgi:hypothetical protein